MLHNSCSWKRNGLVVIPLFGVLFTGWRFFILRALFLAALGWLGSRCILIDMPYFQARNASPGRMRWRITSSFAMWKLWPRMVLYYRHGSCVLKWPMAMLSFCCMACLTIGWERMDMESGWRRITIRVFCAIRVHTAAAAAKWPRTD